MQLTATLRPRKHVKSSKEGIRQAASTRGVIGTAFSNHYSNAMVDKSRKGDEFVIAINYEKRRPKKIQSPRASFESKDGMKVRKTNISERGHWVGHSYRIPLAMLQMLNLKVVQGSRNFKLVPVK